MKKTLIALLVLLSFQVTFAQSDLPVIEAHSAHAFIHEGEDNYRRDWYLSPEYRPDVYKLDRSFSPETVTIYTDVDSFSARLKPGEMVNFVILLNGKDSCFNRFVHTLPPTKYAQLQPATHDTIPFSLTPGNNLKFQAVLNETDTLDLKFDTGAINLILTRDAIVQKTHLLPKGEAQPDFWKMRRGNRLQIGNMSWENLDVQPAQLSGQGTDGRIGWDFFQGRVVEMDYDQNRLIVHSSLTEIPDGYVEYEMEWQELLFRIKGELAINGEMRDGYFLFDNGYQRAILLDSVLMQQEKFARNAPVIKTNELRNGAGKVFVTKVVLADSIQFGELGLTEIPTQLLNQPNPAGFPTHILGNELLKRFNTILDFQHYRIYLQPNGLGGLPYVDAG